MWKMGKWGSISKKKKMVFLAVALLGAGVASLGVYSLQGTWGRRAAAREMPLQEAQAKTGSISNTVIGTGNLEYEEGASITIPSGVVVDEVKVESSQHVAKGDVLAVINQASVLRAMEDVQEEIDALDEEIDDSKDDTDSQSILSKVDGKVKKIYVQEGQEVSGVMLEQGALMILSMEDYMEVENEEDAQISVTATAGVIEEICVSEGDTVYAGTTLLKVSNDGQSLECQEQMAERQELAARLKELLALSKSGVITAESDGIIKSVNISAQNDTESTEGTQDLQKASVASGVQGSASAAENSGLVQASKGTASASGIVQISTKTASVSGNAQLPEAESAEDGSQEEGNEEKDVQGAEADKGIALALQITDSGVCSQSALALETPETGKKPQDVLRAEDGSYEGEVSWKPQDKKFKANTSYQAYVTLTAEEGYFFGSGSLTGIKTGVLSGVSVGEEGKVLSFCITYPFTAAEKTDSQDGDEGNGKDGTGEEGNSGNKNSNGGDTAGNGSNTGEVSGNGGNAGNISGNGGNVGEVSGNDSNTGGYAKANSAQTGSVSASQATTVSSVSQGSSEDGNEEAAESSSAVTAFTMSSADTMVLSVNVDELDINSVLEDQQAVVTLDAIEDETFTGTVTKVGNVAASSNGGVAKYTVELEIPGDERMKEGMNASAAITIEERENVVTIPVNALQERGQKVFVYTQADSEGNLSGEKEVATGLSDGDIVEITEGLSEGDTVYYQKTGNISEQGSFPGFGGKEGGWGGDMPQGDFKGGGSGSGMPDRMPNGGGMPSNPQ